MICDRKTSWELIILREIWQCSTFFPAYWNSWTVDASVGRWTMDARLWTLEFQNFKLSKALEAVEIYQQLYY